MRFVGGDIKPCRPEGLIVSIASSTMSSTDSPQAKLMSKWHEGFQTMNAETLKETLHDNFTYATFPRSLQAPEQTKEQWCEQIGKIIGMWTSMEVSLLSLLWSDLCSIPPAANRLLHY